MIDRVLPLFLLAIVVASDTDLESQFTLPKLLCLQLLTPVLIALWLRALIRRELRPLPRPIAIVLVTSVAWWILVTVLATDPETALVGIYGRFAGLLTQLTLVLVFVIVATLPDDDRALEWRSAAVVLALLPVAMWAMVQFAGFDPRPWPNPRPGSTIGHPVPLAAMLALATPLAAAFVLAEPQASRRRTGAVVLIVLGIALLLTLSRGPWAGAAVAIVIVSVWALKNHVVHADRQLMILLTAVVAIAGARLVFSDQGSLLRQRFVSLWTVDTDPSFVNRFTYVDAGWRMLTLHPIRGNGFDHFGLLYPRYRGVEPAIVPLDELPTRTHNGYLDRAISTGGPGLVLHLALIGLVAAGLWRRRLATGADDHRRRLLAIALLAAIAGFLIQDLSGWDELPLSIYFWIVLGLAVSAARSPGEPVWQIRRSLVTGAAAAVVALALIVQAFGTWQVLQAERLIVPAARADLRAEWPEVATSLERALVLAPDRHHLDRVGLVYFERFAVARDASAYARAAQVFDQAAASNRFDPYLFVHRIDLETLALQSRLVPSASAGALRAASLVTAIDPNNATVHAALARFLLADGKPSDALTAIRRAHELRPSQARYHVIQGDIYGALQRQSEQVSEYRAALGGADEALRPEAVRKHILALISSGQNEEAITEAGTAIARAPQDAVLHNLLGVAYLNRRDATQAAASFRRALEIDPANVTARQALAEVEQSSAAPGDGSQIGTKR